MAQAAVLSSPAVLEPSVIMQSESAAIAAKVAAHPVKAAVKIETADKTPLSAKERDGILKQLNKTLEAFDTHVSLTLDEKSHRTVIKVIDNDTGKVVRQIPDEQMMRISERITQLLGVMYDEKM